MMYKGGRGIIIGIVASLFGAATAQAVTPKIPSYSDLLAFYQSHPEQARSNYDGKRLSFQGRLTQKTDRTAQYFRVTGADGVEFGAHFSVSGLAALQSFFPGGQIKRGVRSQPVKFTCVNKGLEKHGEPALILTDCRISG